MAEEWLILVAVDSDENVSMAVIKTSIYDLWNNHEIETDRDDLFSLMQSEQVIGVNGYAGALETVTTLGGFVGEIVGGLAY